MEFFTSGSALWRQPLAYPEVVCIAVHAQKEFACNFTSNQQPHTVNTNKLTKSAMHSIISASDEFKESTSLRSIRT